MRNLLIFLLVLAGIWWVRRALNRPRGGGGERAADAPRRDDSPERMLACAHCGIHVPESEGVQGDGAFYCCAEHRRAGPGA